MLLIVLGRTLWYFNLFLEWKCRACSFYIYIRTNPRVAEILKLWIVCMCNQENLTVQPPLSRGFSCRALSPVLAGAYH